MALTAIASPYLWSWDFVLLLPLFVDTAARLTNTLSRVVLFVFWAACLVLTVVSIQVVGAGDSRLWWLPPVIITGIALSLQLDEWPDKRATAESTAG
jgi:4-amino-4-deoxy-L-arabinose transferase-like glycosyltransferase